ncbi:hypothetical protein, partial [Microcoleus sp. S13_C3]|uniref:hypothetical protein n=1 Tax=Microcoleus sp. S13_C3 TaxID=3055409 RepID=UPI002FD1B824
TRPYVIWGNRGDMILRVRQFGRSTFVSKLVDRRDSNSLYHIVSGWMGMIKPQSTQRTQRKRTER